MSLKIENISLTTWRNFKEFYLEIAPGLTVLVGPNAVGKTNTIEALQYLTTATSFRKSSPSELILEGYDSSHIQTHLTGDGRSLDIEMRVQDNSRRFLCNNKPIKPSTVSGTLPSILFNPDDLLLVKSSASKRRDELDTFGVQIHQSYRKIYSTYMRSIEQRNHLLKDGITGVLLDSWDESVALGAATLLQYRLRLFFKLKEHIEIIYKEIDDSEELVCSYIPSILQTEDETQLAAPQALLDTSKEDLAHFIEEEFKKNRDLDLRRGQTLLGPHRDDILFAINGRNARKFGSQGQQRSVVLALKMAEVKLCQDLFNNCPLLLLDDVMSELDEQRRHCVTKFINSGIQTVVTTTNLEYFKKDELINAKVVNYERSNS